MENHQNDEQVAEQISELSDDELDMVAGGRGTICPILYIDWGKAEDVAQ